MVLAVTLAAEFSSYVPESPKLHGDERGGYDDELGGGWTIGAHRYSTKHPHHSTSNSDDGTEDEVRVRLRRLMHGYAFASIPLNFSTLASSDVMVEGQYVGTETHWQHQTPNRNSPQYQCNVANSVYRILLGMDLIIKNDYSYRANVVTMQGVALSLSLETALTKSDVSRRSWSGIGVNADPFSQNPVRGWVLSMTHGMVLATNVDMYMDQLINGNFNIGQEIKLYYGTQIKRRFVELEDAIRATLNFVDRHLPVINPDGWTLYKQLCQILRPFEEITSFMSGNKYSASQTKNYCAFVVDTLLVEMRWLSSVGNHCLTDVTNQVLNMPPATPSTSEENCPFCEITFAVCYRKGVRRRNIIPPVESILSTLLKFLSVGQRTETRIIKKCPGANEQQLHREIKKLQKDKDSFQQRLKKARKLSTNSAFQNALKKFKTFAAIFTAMQFREINKPKMGRRFTKEEKIMALSMYKRGPRAYRWLSKIFILPSSVTLSRLLSKAGLKPGFNEKIFNQLHEKLKGMKEHEKLCTLIFDEMAITLHFNYNRIKDRITGFVNYEGESVRKIADHVLVFMIRGIVTNYKQPIFYSFSAESTRILARLIKQIIQELNRIGFTVMATVCDQGTSNRMEFFLRMQRTPQTY
ncbi:hypothetical protein HW555_000450 [Spodoptera exigua]|uniref:Transposable element P transposase-like RNase H domain-containing protein n=1 Tax=Spodoptera exigua TaxID=7107 RepID=A0A835GT39_SPOEX|nr:hypothetical protein HW555_000450 [Spodoptera exigua]